MADTTKLYNYDVTLKQSPLFMMLCSLLDLTIVNPKCYIDRGTPRIEFAIDGAEEDIELFNLVHDTSEMHEDAIYEALEKSIEEIKAIRNS